MHREVRDLSRDERRIRSMKRLLPLLALLVLPAPATALADGCPPSTCGITSVGPPGLARALPPARRATRPSARVTTSSRGTCRFSLPAGARSQPTAGPSLVGRAGEKLTAPRSPVFDARTGKLATRAGHDAAAGTLPASRPTEHLRACPPHAIRDDLARRFEPQGPSRVARRRGPLTRRPSRLHRPLGTYRYVLEQLDLASGRLGPDAARGS